LNKGQLGIGHRAQQNRVQLATQGGQAQFPLRVALADIRCVGGVGFQHQTRGWSRQGAKDQGRRVGVVRCIGKQQHVHVQVGVHLIGQRLRQRKAHQHPTLDAVVLLIQHRRDDELIRGVTEQRQHRAAAVACAVFGDGAQQLGQGVRVVDPRRGPGRIGWGAVVLRARHLRVGGVFEPEQKHRIERLGGLQLQIGVEHGRDLGPDALALERQRGLHLVQVFAAQRPAQLMVRGQQGGAVEQPARLLCQQAAPDALGGVQFVRPLPIGLLADEPLHQSKEQQQQGQDQAHRRKNESGGEALALPPG